MNVILAYLFAIWQYPFCNCIIFICYFQAKIGSVAILGRILKGSHNVHMCSEIYENPSIGKLKQGNYRKVCTIKVQGK